MRARVKHEFTVSADHRTLWVNSGVTAANIARFSAKGIDIHRDFDPTNRHQGHCLFCRPGPEFANPIPLETEWQLFQDKLLEHYNLRVPKRIRMETR